MSLASLGHAPDIEVPPASEQAELERHTPWEVLAGESRRGGSKILGAGEKCLGSGRQLTSYPSFADAGLVGSGLGEDCDGGESEETRDLHGKQIR